MWEERGRERPEGQLRSRRARRQGTHNSGDQAGEGSREPREADVQVLQQQHEEKEGEAGCHGRAGQARGEGQVCLACERRRETERRGAGKMEERGRGESVQQQRREQERKWGESERERETDTRAGHEGRTRGTGGQERGTEERGSRKQGKGT